MKLRRILLRLFVLVLWGSGQIHAALLVPTASIWRWRPGTNEASTPVNLWREIGFNDTEFSAGAAPFWDGDIPSSGTQITGSSSLFLRQTFLVPDVTAVGALRLGALADDGFVAWINGTEVKRVNIPGAPGAPLSTATLASIAAEPAVFTTYNLPSPAGYLVSGTNVLAVQVFQAANSKLGFECSLESLSTAPNPPTVLSVQPSPGLITHLTQVTVTFNQPVTGVAAAHLLVNGLGATSVTALDSSTYLFGFVQPPYGNVNIGWSSAHNICDQAEPANRFDATSPGGTWNYTLLDQTVPVVAAISPRPGSLVHSLGSISVLFSEPVVGVDPADLLLNNRPASSLTRVAASQYIFSFPQPATGTVEVAWVTGHGIRDDAAAPNAFAGGAWTYRLHIPVRPRSIWMAGISRTMQPC